jgi:3-oxoacyl-[acyl-carrier protein] reductase
VPGYLETEMTSSFKPEGRQARERLSPQRRFGQVEEVAACVLYLASGEASFVNGDALYVAGAVRDVPDLR